MKKLTLIAAMTMLLTVLASCGKYDASSFVGTWGVDRIDYYNIDYAGNPIEYTTTTFDFTPGDMENGIDLVFREDQTGEMRDRSRDTLYLPVMVADTVDHYDTIICPDTTLVTRFTFSYDSDNNWLYMNLQGSTIYTYHMSVKFTDADNFIYENNYKPHTVEKAWMVRYSKETRGAKSSPVYVPRHEGSLLSNY